MANNVYMINDMEFEEKLKQMGDNQLGLLLFIARQQYSMSKRCPVHDKRIQVLEKRDTKFMGTIGGIGALIGAAVASAIDLIIRR